MACILRTLRIMSKCSDLHQVTFYRVDRKRNVWQPLFEHAFLSSTCLTSCLTYSENTIVCSVHPSVDLVLDIEFITESYQQMGFELVLVSSAADWLPHGI